MRQNSRPYLCRASFLLFFSHLSSSKITFPKKTTKKKTVQDGAHAAASAKGGTVRPYYNGEYNLNDAGRCRASLGINHEMECNMHTQDVCLFFFLFFFWFKGSCMQLGQLSRPRVGRQCIKGCLQTYLAALQPGDLTFSRR